MYYLVTLFPALRFLAYLGSAVCAGGVWVEAAGTVFGALLIINQPSTVLSWL